jgi:hypothetical protein
MTIRELIDGIEKLDLVLPEFQREYVWEKEQAKQLIVSLFKGYPTGSLLFWKTDNPPDIKNNAVNKDKIGTTMVILDGQQRLTTLYLFVNGKIPPYYIEQDIQNDPRNLYFDVDSGEFMYYQPKLMDSNPTWVSVVNCFNGKGPSVFDVAKAKAGDQGGEAAFKLAEAYNEKLNRLKNIIGKPYPIQTVPSDAKIDEAIDVFDKVNSMGTKLTEAELALAHICGKWPQARQVIKEKIRELEKHHYYFDITFMVRALTGVVKKRALFWTIHETPEQELKEGWTKLTVLLNYLINILGKHACVHSTEDLNTSYVLVPPLVYLSKKNGKFTDQKDINLFVHWLYAASTWARYTGQTNQRLDQDISIIDRNGDPWKELEDNIIDQRGRIDLKAADLEGRDIQHPAYRMAYIIIKRRGAFDWFDGRPLDVQYGPSYSIHSHHIFPSSVLYKEGGYTTDNHLHKKIVNEIANRTFLTGTSNQSLQNTPPDKYFPGIIEKFPGALEKQLIPMDENLWKLERYEDFLAKRRELIADAYNELMDSLLKGVVLEKKLQTLDDYLKAGESATLEYKSTLRWDVKEKQVNKALQKVIAKTIAGFLNFGGGLLLIGVVDDGSIYGIEDDMKTLKGQNTDAFQQSLIALVTEYLGAEYAGFISISFEVRDGKTICIVKIESSPKPVFLCEAAGKEFYVRVGNTTRQLDVQATHEYIGMHW